MQDQATPNGFSKALRDLRRADKMASVFAAIPKNKRPFYESVIKNFENDEICHSPSGMTANIVACWLRATGAPFVIEYDPEHGGYFTIRRK